MVKLSDFTCDNCIKRRNDICGKDKDNRLLPEDRLGCDEGSWIVQMIKWKGYINDKESPVYTISWDWVAAMIGKGKDRFKILEIEV